ncbi:MAG TPA: FAD-binding oxidoreductase [Gemmatimonadales bacterium]|nr:FAD-binding oxidoreductase [Gemmatimonadales bacterium]
MRDYRSWGRYPDATPAGVVPVVWRSEPPPLERLGGPVLPYACGRSYGDSCLNDGGLLLDVRRLDRLIAFDEERGLLRCEAGVSLAAILALTVPRGWFLPVLPGTRWVSVGGAIANDIHGKNHHRAGTFGAHVTRLELVRSTGDRIVCTPDDELFRATVGGLGLTGLIMWAEIRLKPVPGPGIAMERIRFSGLDAFFELAAEDQRFEYTAAWVDCLARGRRLGRGIYLRGDHAPLERQVPSPLRPARLRVPAAAPPGLLNRVTLGLFNESYYRGQLRARRRATVPYAPFFFPLDGVGDWSRLYGPRGFLQYQCVVPDEPGGGPIRTILERISRSGEPASLAVLKRFGGAASPGLLSFPRAGMTLAVDFAFHGRLTLALLDELDAVVREAGGAVYPAKDARMSPQSFRAFFPQLDRFAGQRDPKFSSSFWRRVHAS